MTAMMTPEPPALTRVVPTRAPASPDSPDKEHPAHAKVYETDFISICHKVLCN